MGKGSKIFQEIGRLRRVIADAAEQIKEIQDKKCKHSPVFLQEEYKSNTGNYDPSSDSYWVYRECTNCGKRWIITSNEPDYHSLIPLDKRFQVGGKYLHKDAYGGKIVEVMKLYTA